jgi:hypothetical protein
VPVKYHLSGVKKYCVRLANESTGPDSVFFQATTVSGRGWNRAGCCSVR